MKMLWKEETAPGGGVKQTERRKKKFSITIYKEENISTGKKTDRVSQKARLP